MTLFLLFRSGASIIMFTKRLKKFIKEANKNLFRISIGVIKEA